jgi:modification methylase
MMDKPLLFNSSSENMDQIPSESVHLVVTSPPYNCGIDDTDSLPEEDYAEMILDVAKECYRVLVSGGRLAINVANIGRKPYQSRVCLVRYLVQHSAPWLSRGEIIWVKGKAPNGSCSWGSWMSPANPTLRDRHEYILVWSKGDFQLQGPGEPTISKEEFLKATSSVWDDIGPELRRNGHPSPFPIGIPRRLIELYSFSGQTVLDPFMGSGTTGIACMGTGRSFIGYELNDVYFSIAEQRIEGSWWEGVLDGEEEFGIQPQGQEPLERSQGKEVDARAIADT